MATFVGSDPIAFRWESAPVLRAVNRATVRALNRIKEIGVEEAKGFAHVRTGAMRAHVFGEIDTDASGRVVLVLGDDVENEEGFPYGATEELTSGHEYLRPAADVVVPLIPDYLAAAARGEGF